MPFSNKSTALKFLASQAWTITGGYEDELLGLVGDELEEDARDELLELVGDELEEDL
jgi:hypothetical protein